MITCFAHKQHQNKVFVIQNINGNKQKNKKKKQR